MINNYSSSQPVSELLASLSRLLKEMEVRIETVRTLIEDRNAEIDRLKDKINELLQMVDPCSLDNHSIQDSCGRDMK